MLKPFLSLVAALFAASVVGDTPQAQQVWLDSLDLQHVQQGWGKPHAGKSVEGNPIKLGGKTYAHGIGTHAEGCILIDLRGAAASFQAFTGVDDERKGHGSVTFSVIVDNKEVFTSKALHGGDAPVEVNVDLKGAQKLLLVVGDGGDGIGDDHADWANASITLAPDAAQKPGTITLDEPPRMKIPEPASAPAIHGPRIVGSTPGRPFLFSVAATGDAPLNYTAENLSEGLHLDAATGIITGSLAHDGTTKVTLTVTNSAGKASRVLSIVGGANQLALTPPMGWNSWNVWADTVNEGEVRNATDQLVSTGLKAHGFDCVNIDDCWQGKRDKNGEITSNKKFTSMKALCDDLHAKGFKAGIYSSPGPKTCGGYAGSFKHEQQDADTYAKWGFDFLKYDLCSYGSLIPNRSEENVRPPYSKMASSLANTGRDIVYSLCEYGDGDVWKWGASPDIHGNLWRTYSDIDDVWTGSSGWGANRGVYNIIQKQVGLEKYAGPGHWNDPDMLMVGRVGFGHPHPTQLTKNEQLVHVSMWCMMAAPLLIGCDLTKLDPFTFAILTNDELLDIDQDPLGKAASRISKGADGSEIWARELSDGTHAVALMNTRPIAQKITADWAALGLAGQLPVRDLWLHEDEGAFDGSYSANVPGHGIVILKIGRPTM